MLCDALCIAKIFPLPSCAQLTCRKTPHHHTRACLQERVGKLIANVTFLDHQQLADHEPVTRLLDEAVPIIETLAVPSRMTMAQACPSDVEPYVVLAPLAVCLLDSIGVGSKCACSGQMLSATDHVVAMAWLLAWVLTFA